MTKWKELFVCMNVCKAFSGKGVFILGFFVT